MYKTVKTKFIILVLTIVTFGAGIPTFFLLSQLKDNFQQRSLVMLDVTLDVLTSSIVNCLKSGGNSKVQSIINNVAQNRNISHIRIISPSGRILHSSAESEKGLELNEVASSHANILKNSKFINNDIELKENGYYVALHAIYNKKSCQKCHAGEGNILAYFDVDTKLTTAEKKFYTGAFHTLFLALVIFLLMIVGLYIAYNKLINKPLKKIINGLDEVGDGNLDISLDVRETDEFGIINNHFNTMVSSMKKAKEQIEEMSFKELEHTDKLATIGQLTAEISHEINNPTAIIMSRADYLSMEAEDNSSLKKYIEDFDTIYKQTEKISGITKNVLKYSRKLPSEFTKIDITETIQNALTILKLKLSKQNVVVNEKFASENFIYGNAIQIEQIIINLVQNAMDSLSDNGVINVNTSNENKKIILQISDNGHGMDEETKQKIFAPFFTTKPENVGTGLGMFIIDKICKNHKAQILCESEIGVGTTFKIIFNRYEEIK